MCRTHRRRALVLSFCRVLYWRAMVKPTLSIDRGVANEGLPHAVRHDRWWLGLQLGLFLYLNEEPRLMSIKLHEDTPGRLGTHGLSPSFLITTRWWLTAVYGHHHPSQLSIFAFIRRREGVSKPSLRMVMTMKCSRASSRASRTRRLWYKHHIHNSVLTWMPIIKPSETYCIVGLRYRTHDEFWERGQE